MRGYLYAATRCFVHAFSSSASAAAPGLQDDDRCNFLSELVVWHPDDRRVENIRVGVQRLLDLARVHVVAAADHELLLPVDEEEVSVSVEAAEIPGRQPAVRGDRGGRRPRFVPVSGDDRRSAELNLPHARLVGVGDPQLGLAERRADRPGTSRVPDRVRRRNTGHLGEAVAFDEPAAERSLEVVGDLVRYGCAADVRDPDGRQRRRRAGRLAERDAHRRDAKKDRRPRRGHPCQGSLAVESPLDGDRASAQ